MEDIKIRQEVRKVLMELMQQVHPAYPINGGNNQFPYAEEDGIVQLPEEISAEENYLINWEEVSSNNDLYNFPIEEFKKGISIERARNNAFNILDVAKIVINNLQDNPRFYSNLGV